MPDHVKFCHLSDTHLGCTQYGLHQRALDFGTAFEDALRLIANECPDFVIHTGDIFDRSLPPPFAIRQFRHAYKAYLQPQHIPLVLLAGNHDTARCVRGAGSQFFGRWARNSTPALLHAQGLVTFLDDATFVLQHATGRRMAILLGLRFYGKHTPAHLRTR